jgi:hypothetical protein
MIKKINGVVFAVARESASKIDDINTEHARKIGSKIGINTVQAALKGTM